MEIANGNGQLSFFKTVIRKVMGDFIILDSLKIKFSSEDSNMIGVLENVTNIGTRGSGKIKKGLV